MWDLHFLLDLLSASSAVCHAFSSISAWRRKILRNRLQRKAFAWCNLTRMFKIIALKRLPMDNLKKPIIVNRIIFFKPDVSFGWLSYFVVSMNVFTFPSSTTQMNWSLIVSAFLLKRLATTSAFLSFQQVLFQRFSDYFSSQQQNSDPYVTQKTHLFSLFDSTHWA